MPQVIETTVYTLKELTDQKAREKAFEWLSEAATSFDWWDSVYDDAKNVGLKIDGFDVYRRDIDFRLAWDAISVALAIRENHGEACDTYALAVAFISKHDEYHGVNGKITLAESEEGTLADYSALQAEWEELEADFERDLAACYLKTLRDEYEYITSEEALADFAEANEYTFTAEGKRFG